MGQVHAKKVSFRPAAASSNDAGPELAESVMAVGEDVVVLLGQAIQKFQGDDFGSACQNLGKLQVELSETLSKIDADLNSLPPGSDRDPESLAKLLLGVAEILGQIKDKSLRKLGEACCKTDAKPEACTVVVKHLQEKIKLLSGIMKAARKSVAVRNHKGGP